MLSDHKDSMTLYNNFIAYFPLEGLYPISWELRFKA